MKLLVILFLMLTASVAYSAIQNSIEFADRKHAVAARTVTIQFYTPPVMLYGKPIPGDPDAQMPDWYRGPFKPIQTE